MAQFHARYSKVGSAAVVATVAAAAVAAASVSASQSKSPATNAAQTKIAPKKAEVDELAGAPEYMRDFRWQMCKDSAYM